MVTTYIKGYPALGPHFKLQRIGTPSEDAYRRDFTMNSLFYNVTEGKIEDYTQQVLLSSPHRRFSENSARVFQT